MPFIETRDGTRLAYEDYGTGTPIVFVAGWSLGADMWEYQVPFFLRHGYRCVLVDRRGHGRSDRASTGYDVDTLAEDLADLITHLDLRGATLVGHSFGGVEIAHYLDRHPSGRVDRAVFVAACLPSMRRSAANPDGLGDEVIEATLASLRADRPRWLADRGQSYFATHLGNTVSPALIDETVRQCLTASPVAAIQVQEANLAASHESELDRLDLPTLVVHGDADASAPVDLTGRRTAKALPGCVYREYPGAGHGLYVTHAAALNGDILDFLRS
ncbi:MAG: alpha/beta hydrolase [Actinocatenispora sp.]